MTEGGPELSPAERVLLEEACRLADRLDRLDAILRGDLDAWMRFRASDDGAEVTVVVDRVLSEARQQQLALRQVLAELRQSRAGAKQLARRGAGAATRLSAGKGGTVADLTSRIRARAQTAG